MTDGPDPERGLRGRDLSWTSSTYFAEGLPWSVLHQIAGEYLTAIGVSATQVGRTSYLHAGTSFKVLWSPIVDLFGSLRQWMIGMQVAMGVAMGVLAVIAHEIAQAAGHPDPTLIWITLAGISFLSATHDIACDGYYMDALDRDDQARYSGVRVAAFRGAMLLGSSFLVFLGGRFNWMVGFGTAAAIMGAVGLAHRFWLPRGRSETALPAKGDERPARSRKDWAHVRDAYASFFSQDRVVFVLAFLISYKMADAVMFSMSKVLLARELGVTTDLRGIVNSFSIGSQIAGAMVGGAWIARKGLAKTLLPITLAMALTEPLYVGLAHFAPQLALSDPAVATTMADYDVMAALPSLMTIVAIVITEQFCGGMATAAQMVFIMRRCHPDHKAAHFAFATAVYATAQMIVGGESGTIYDAIGPVSYFWFTAALTIPAVVVVKFVPKD